MSTDDHWEAWGRQDPYFGVLTNPKFRSAVLTDEAKQEFFASGQGFADYLLALCRRHADPAFQPRRILDFGCGVGRVLIPFAALSEEAVGVDVSPSMLEEARRNCAARGVANATLVLSDDTLSRVEGDFDLVHSSIVLQHIAIDRGREIFRELVRRVRPGGIGALHVTFAWDYFDARYGQPPPPPQTWWGRLRRHVQALRKKADAAQEDPEMQMNFYNLSELMYLLQRAGVRCAHVEFSDHGGAIGALLLFSRPAA